MLISGRTYQAKFLSVAFCLLSLFLLTACNIFGNGNTTSPQSNKAAPDLQTFTSADAGVSTISTLDPALAQDPSSIAAIQMLYTGLVQLNDQLQVQPQLAQNWSVGKDGVTWTFHLKPHLTFSDGTPLTSADVAYSINRALQPATKSQTAPIYLSMLKDANQLLTGHIPTLINDSILTPDPNTVVLITSKPAPYFLTMLAQPCSYVVEKSLVQKYGSAFTTHLKSGGGAGPFTVASYVPDSHISFVPDTHYYGPQPQLHKVTFAFYANANSAYQAYQNHQVDQAPVPLNMLNDEQKQNDFHQIPQLWLNYYGMNYLTKPFDNIHIRQAFALAINKVALAQNVWHGSVIPTNHIVPQGMVGYNPALTGPDGTQNLSGNSSKAQALLQQGLAEEHWNSVSQIPPIHLTYAKGDPELDQEISTLIQSWQNVLHIQVIPNPVDYNTLLRQVTAATNNTHGIQMWELSWVGEYPDPQNWLTYQFGKGATYNNMNYGENTSSDAAQQQKIQAQLALADSTTNNSTRIKLYQQAEQQIVNDVGWIPMEQVTNTFVRNPAIVGIVDNAQGTIPPNDWAHIYRAR
ncbi:MAG TPA: peptide ABC transporter substrate-binding protein [Dictyobacter sp.]|jgi:peptide/nickel transport system substrate-binding protein/oligopeptide transport system substrate-binding protein|nr:peptide ABC transporter substrate-binding protein [Dictyobacter sp.]